MLAALAALLLTTSPGYASPEHQQLMRILSGRISSHYGYRKSDCIFHPGVDIAAPVGTPVRAAADGAVRFAGATGQGIGIAVLIQHPTQWGGDPETLYGHLSRVAVKSGSTVKRGDIIGWVGTTGNARGPHLHLEFRFNGKPEDPETWPALL